MPKKPEKRPNFMKRFRAILREEEHKLADAKRMQEHAQKASEFYAAGRIEEAEQELQKAERFLKK